MPRLLSVAGFLNRHFRFAIRDELAADAVEVGIRNDEEIYLGSLLDRTLERQIYQSITRQVNWNSN